MAPAQDYYKVLEVDSKATQQQIRDAYKKAALKHHPDRVPSDSPERPRRTKKFQQINDAYYTLSDPQRRREYDVSRPFTSFTSGNTSGASSGRNTRNTGSKGSAPGTFPSSTFEEDDDYDEEIPRPNAGGGGGFGFNSFPFSTFASAFGFGSGANAQAAGSGSGTSHHDGNAQFQSVFEEMMAEEGLADDSDAHTPTGKFWSLVGGVSGGAMGFIVANFAGAAAGAVAGNRLGAVRDKKGKSVYSVFQELPQADKAKLLSELAQKVFAHAVSA